MRRPLKHKPCGTLVMWYLDQHDNYKQLLSALYERPDGTKPEFGERWRERCSTCNRVVFPWELRLEGVDDSVEEL